MAEDSNSEVVSQPSVLDGIGSAFSDSELQVGMGPAGMLEFITPEPGDGGEDSPENPEASGGTEQADEPVAAAEPAAQPEVQTDVVPKEQYDNLRSMNDRRFNDLADKYKALEAKLEAALASDDPDDGGEYEDEDGEYEDGVSSLSSEDRAMLMAARQHQEIQDEALAFQARIVKGEVSQDQLNQAMPYMQLEFERADELGVDLPMDRAYELAVKALERFGPLRSAGSAAGNNGSQPGIPQGATPAPASKPAANHENAEALRERSARLQTETSASVAGEDTFRNRGPKKPVKTIDDAMDAAWKEMQAS